MGDVDEGGAHLGLDALELDLHLAPQLEVERAQRLVEEQHARLVDEGPRHGDALLLATGELRRLAPRHGAELHQLQHVVDRSGHVLDPATA